MNASFWRGFQKKASEENPFAIWVEQADDEQKALDEKKEKPYRSDPRDLSEGYPPDAWYRYWP
jgi:hypothetical protein